MANSILFTYYALESKNTYEYHYYYFAGYDDAGNVVEILVNSNTTDHIDWWYYDLYPYFFCSSKAFW